MVRLAILKRQEANMLTIILNSRRYTMTLAEYRNLAPAARRQARIYLEV